MKAPTHLTAASAGRGPAHVLLTTDAVGGVWTYALDLSRGLAAAGTQVTLAVMGPAAAADQRDAAARVPGVELVDTSLPLDWLAADRTELRDAAEGLAELARRTGADLVHLNSPALAAEVRFPVPVVGVAHSDVRTWWEAVEAGPLPNDLRWRAELLAEGYAACDLVLAPSAAFAELTERAYGVAPRVVWNGRAPPADAGATTRKRRVVTAGRLWDRGKDVATLDAAAAGLGAPVVAYGPAEGPHGERAAFSHLQLAGRVDAPALEAALRGARVFASAARYEPFGLAVLEAAQAGCALVLSDIATFRELWDGAALFAPAGDAGAFAAAMRRLLDDEAEADRLGAAARERAERYGLAPFVAGVRAAYDEALGAPARGVAA